MKNNTNISAQSSDKLKLNAVYFNQRKQESKESQDNKGGLLWFNDGSDFTERLRAAVSACNSGEHILISFSASQGGLQNFLNEAAAKICTTDVVMGCSNAKNQRTKEWISGFKTAELHSAYAIISPSVAAAALNSGNNLNEKYDCLYALNKSASSWHNISLSIADEMKVMPGIKDKLRVVFSHLNPAKFKLDPLRHSFWALCILVLIAMTTMSKQAGISGDEFTQYRWADTAIIPYYTEGKETAINEDKKTLMHLYGSSFDTFTAMMVRITGTEDIYELRHFWNAVFGFFCILFAAKIVRTLTNSYKWAIIAMVLLFFTPRLLGDSLNNPKDIPFATGYLMGLYYAIRYYGRNGGRLGQMLGLIFGIALAISIRIGGLVLMPTIGLLAALSFIQGIGWNNFTKFKWVGFVKFAGNFILIAVMSYLLGIALWPYGIDEPFSNPFKALSAFTNFQASLSQLFEGKFTESSVLPSHYLSKYLLITMPIVSLLGIVFYLLLGFTRKNYNHTSMIVLFAAVFPVFYIWFQQSNVYGGMRQILFVVPCLVVSGVMGFYLLEKWLSKWKWVSLASPAMACVLVAPPAIHTAKNHPLTYIYFNELVGGVKGAYSYYEMDYYLGSLKQSTEWLLENVVRKNPNKKYFVQSYGMDHVKYYCRKDKNIRVGFTQPKDILRWTNDQNNDWDYLIFYNGFTDHNRLSKGFYPPAGTVYTPMVDGKPMGWVVERKSRDDYAGYKALMNNEFRLSIEKFNSYITASGDNKNAEIYFYLANAYANANNIDSAIIAGERSFNIFPGYKTALTALHTFYMRKGLYDKSLSATEKYIDAASADGDIYWIKSQSLAGKKEFNQAFEFIEKAIGAEPLKNPEYYKTGALICQALKKDDLIRDYFTAQQLSSKNPKEQEAAILSIQTIYERITGQELDLTKYQ
jgi:tetratricopeptide (TPR) repeat protein